MRLPTSSATRSPLCRPACRSPAATAVDCCATSRQVIRLVPQTSASPSGFLAAASDTIAQMLPGRSQNAGTTRSPKRASSRMAGMESCDQSLVEASSLESDSTGAESDSSANFLFEHALFGKPVSTFPDHALALRLHAVDMFRTRESAGAHVGGIALDRGLDHGCEVAIAADKFRRPR